MKREPFHVYHARRQLIRDTTLPTLQAPAVTVRLRRSPPRPRDLPMKLALSIAAVFAVLLERIS